MHQSTLKYARIPHWGLIVVSILLAVMLSIIPLPEALQYAWPDWINLVVFYWVIALPSLFGVIFGWCNGLLEDIVSFSLLGEFALGKALTGFVAAMISHEFKYFNYLERMIIVFVLQSTNIAITSWVNLLAFDTPIQGVFWLSALATSLVWPLVVFTLDQLDPTVS